MAAIVTEEIIRERDLPDDLYPDKNILFRHAAHCLEKSKILFGEEERQEAADFFRGAKEQLLLRVDWWEMDEAGRANAKAYILGFYQVLDTEYPAAFKCCDLSFETLAKEELLFLVL